MKIQKKITVAAFLFIAIAVIFAGCDMGNNVESDPGPEEENHKLTVSVMEPDVEESSMRSIEKANVNLTGTKNLARETDAEGKAVFADLKAGNYKLSVSKQNYEVFDTEIDIQQANSEPTMLSKEIVITQENSAEIIPEETEYNVAQPDDVSALIEWNIASEVTEVSMVMDREDFDVEAKEFSSLNEDSGTLIIKNDFLKDIAEPESEINIYVGFDEGSDGLLTINVVEEEIKTDAEITPSETEFNLAEPENVRTAITWNQATELEELRLNLLDDDYSVQNIDSSYTLDDNTLIIYSDFLLEQDYIEGDTLEFVLDFDKGDSATLSVEVIDQKDDDDGDDEDEDEDEDEIEPGDITVAGNFNIEHSFPHSEVEMNAENMGSSELWQVEPEKMKEFTQNKSEELILRFQKGLSEKEVTEKVYNLGYEKLDYMPELNAMLVEISAEVSFSQAKAQVKEETSILSSQQNNVFSIKDYKEPNDEYYYKQWAPSVIRLPQTWRNVQGSDNTRVAILDTGIDYNHMELEGLVDLDSGYDFSSDYSTDFVDRHGHGTHVAGIAGALSNNDVGLAGIMWDVSFLPVKVLDDTGRGDEWSVSQGILHAAGLRDDSPIQPADVINMSLGMQEDETPELMEEAIEKAADEGVLLIAASGNSGNRNIAYPAKFEDVIAVGALTQNESGPPALANYSSYGPELDIVAPGTDIWSLYRDDQIWDMSGTSMAAPQVAGLAGLMISEGIDHDDVLDVMIDTAIDLGEPGYNEEYGHGMINTYWGVHEATEINFLVGERNGRDFNAVAESSAAVNDGEFTINYVPEGEYEVMAWLDVRGSNDLENGDYFASTGEVELEDGEYTFDLNVEEFHQD